MRVWEQIASWVIFATPYNFMLKLRCLYHCTTLNIITYTC